jgi:hypothetical protein
MTSPAASDNLRTSSPTPAAPKGKLEANLVILGTTAPERRASRSDENRGFA